jgi:hypothetical protein
MGQSAVKPVLVIASMIAVAAMGLSSSGQACEPVVVRAAVEVAGPEVSLADLLAPSACPALLRAAARVRVGSTPLAGTVRVLEGDEVRAFLRKVQSSSGSGAVEWSSSRVPERVTIRRAGARASCAAIGKHILAALPAPAERTVPQSEFACGGAGRIAEDSPLEPAKIAWNPALSSWEVSARCVRSADCVPFLVRVRGDNPLPRTDRSVSSVGTINARPETKWPAPRLHVAELFPEAVKPLVRAGENATLSWDEAGIRLLVPVVCLEPGRVGQKVRARIVRGGRVVHAVVVSAGQLQMAS